MDSSYHAVPYAVCPDSGNEYSVYQCDAIHTCSCGCSRNLAELFDQQKKYITERKVYFNEVKGRRS